MLTSDREYNKDFDTNNLFLNLDFQNQEETFEYKYPLLDHPSNYQLIVTKFLTRTSLPYIKLEDSKKRKVDGTIPNDTIKRSDNFYYDYPIRADFFLLMDGGDLYNFSRKQYLITPNAGNESKRFADVYLMPFDTMEDTNEIKKYIDFMNEYEHEELPNLHGWHDSNDHRNIYSLHDIYLMINQTLRELLKRVGDAYINMNDKHFKKIANVYRDNWCINFAVENNVPKLVIRKELFDQMFTTNGYWDKDDDQRRLMKIFFPVSLMKFFKGLPIRPFKEYGEYCYIYFDSDTTADTKHYVTVKTKKNLTYYEFTGEKINLTEISDYIGVAITSPDFPVKEQIYPHFEFDFKRDFGKLNRRRYISKSEQNIGGIFNRNTANEIIFEDEHINDLTKSSIGEKILFVKYFGKDDELNCINYENNNINTTQKIDLMNVMPLKKFTLKLYLIDRYNNFEPLCPQINGYEDVVKLQLLFTRIKGSEKENRNFIETKMSEPERVHLDIFEEEEENEESENVEEQQLIPVPIPIPVPVTEAQPEEEEEEEILEPPEKKIYLNQEEEEIENPENELY